MNNPSPGHLWIIFTLVYRLGILSALFFIAYFPWSTKPATYGEFRSDSAHRQANLDRAAVVIPAIRRLSVRSSRKLLATDPGLLPVQVLSEAQPTVPRTCGALRCVQKCRRRRQA